MKLRRVARIGFTLLAAVVALIFTAGLWIFATQSGARFALARVISASNGVLAVDTVEGHLRDELVLTGVRFRDPRLEVDIDRLSLRVSLASIFARMIVVEDVASTTVRVRWLGAVAGGPADAGPVRVPLQLQVNRATVSGLAIERGDDRLDLERITLSGSVAETAAVINRLELRALGLFLSLQGDVSWEDAVALDGIVSWEGRYRDQQWRGSAEFRGNWPALEIEQEMLEPFAQTARGTVLFDSTPNADLVVDWAGLGELAVVAELDPAASIVRGTVQGQGLTPAALVPAWPGELAVGAGITASFGETIRIESDDLSAVASLGEDSIALDFAGALTVPDTLVIERLVAVHGPNEVSVTGAAGGTLDLAIIAALEDLGALAALAGREELAPLDIARWVPEGLSGRAAADLTVSGTRDSPELAGSLLLQDSAFAGLPLALSARFAAASPEAPGIRIESFDAALGASRVSAEGTLDGLERAADGRFDGIADLSANAGFGELAEIAALFAHEEVQALLGREIVLDRLAGSASADIRVTGDLRQPVIDLTLSATDPAYAGIAISGASIAAQGSIDASGFDGTLEALSLAESRVGTWTLQRPVTVRLGRERIDVPEACLVQAGNAICGEWRYGGDDDAVRLFADDLDLALVGPFLPGDLTLDGRLNLDASIAALATGPRGRIEVRGADISIALGTGTGDALATTLESLTIDAVLEDPALRLDASVTGLAGGTATLSLASTDMRDQNGLISGQVDVDWPDLSGLALLSPDIGEVAGRLTVGIGVGGTMAQPVVGGSAALSGGLVTVPQWGLVIESIDAIAESPDGKTLEFSGSGLIDNQELTLSGMTVLDPAANWPTELSIRGDRLLVARRTDAIVYASPDLDVTIDLPRISVTGEVLVPEAEISVEDLPAQAVRVSPDAVVHGDIAVEPNRPLVVTADITLVLGDAVRYRGSNLVTDLSGTLRLDYESGQSPEASGNIRMEGDYDAYGQNLVLERGELLFAGPLNNPALDVLAVRRIGDRPGIDPDIVVGIRLSGTLLQPVPTVYSDPAMSEANALSYLRFGRPLTATDGTETATVESMAIALGLQQAMPAVQRVGESIGLDELSIAPTDLDAGSLMAGKYLSPKVYMSYTYGLFNRIGGFLLRYDINDRFSLETRSGDDKSMDLLYSVEKE